MAKTKTIVKHCSKCNKPFSTADDSVILCRECTSKELKDEAAKELERQNEVAETRTCSACDRNFVITVGSKEFFEKRGLTLPHLCPDCRELLKKRKKEMGGLEHVCKTCGKKFTYSAATILKCALNGWELFDECPDCRRARKEQARAAKQADRQKVVATITCKDCGKEFVVTAGEEAFLKKHGLEHLPSRCPDCRHKRKVRILAEDMRRFGDGDASENQETEVVIEDTTPLDNISAMMSDIAPAPVIQGAIDDEADNTPDATDTEAANEEKAAPAATAEAPATDTESKKSDTETDAHTGA